MSEGNSNNHMDDSPFKRPFLPRAVRVLAVPIILAWIALTVALNVFVPQLEEVTNERGASMVPSGSPSVKAMVKSGEVFHESRSSSTANVLLESDQPLGADAHRYYDDLVRRLHQDKAHVPYVMDLWSNPLLAAGNQSNDGKMATLLLRLEGDIGEAKANESIEAVRKMIADKGHPPPKGLKVYVTGSAPLSADGLRAADESMETMTLVTVVVVAVLVLFVYRSVVTLLFLLATIMVELYAGKAVVSFLAENQIIGISSFATSMVVALILGAGTDYGIFLLGRYHEERRKGRSREEAYDNAYQGTSHVILGSGLAICGACACLSFARLSYFSTMGPVCAIGVFVAILAALTLGPALLVVLSKLGFLDPGKAKDTERLWRRVGTVVVRWPVPVFVVSTAVVLLGAISLPTYVVDYNERNGQPANTPSNIGYQAADRHFPQSRLDSEMLMIEADHDLRNSTDMIGLDRVAKRLTNIPGVAMVQSITRGMGEPTEHASIPFILGNMGSKMGEYVDFFEATITDMGTMSDIMAETIKTQERSYELAQMGAEATHITYESAKTGLALAKEMRDKVGYFDDYMRPFRNYFYWETYCYDLPWCWAFRSLFDMLDSIDKVADEAADGVKAAEIGERTTPENLRLLEKSIGEMRQTESLSRGMVSTFKALMPEMRMMQQQMLDLGHTFEDAKNDDFFYLPPAAFDSPDFQASLKYMVSSDGKAARFTISHEGEALSTEGIAHDEAIRQTAREAVKGTTLAGSRVYLGGAAATYWDIRDLALYDLVIAAIATLSLIFLIMLVIIRSLAAAFVILFTVVLSFAGAFGLSVFIWQHLFHSPMNWLCLPLSFIVLVAVGSDYNLLLIARLKEEVSAGVRTGLVRAMGSTGGVVTTAGVVFAATMGAMLASDLMSIGQAGSTICIGLLLDTLIVRTFITPSIARLMGRWFWWPLRIRERPVPRRLARSI